MAEPRLYVVDNSVAAKWHLRDEKEFADEALALLQHFVDGEIFLTAPDCIVYEFGSAIRGALRDGRLTLEDARAALDDFAAWDIPLAPTQQLARRALELANQFSHPIYDCYYRALAESLRCPFVHADEKLRKKLNGQFDFEMWIEDYPHS